MLTLCWKPVTGDRLLHHFQHLDGLCCRSDLVFVVMQNVQASLPVSLETGVAYDDSNVGTFAGCE
jgi:hypothetical protein